MDPLLGALHVLFDRQPALRYDEASRALVEARFMWSHVVTRVNTPIKSPRSHRCPGHDAL